MAEVILRESPSGPDVTVQAPITTSAAPVTVAVPALPAAGDAATVAVPFATAEAGDFGIVTSATLVGNGVVISGCAISLANGLLHIFVVATKAYAGGNNDFFPALIKTIVP